jgi:hypothetical protein
MTPGTESMPDNAPPSAPTAAVPVLGYGDAAGEVRGRRWAAAAFLWSFFSPLTVAAVMYLLVEGLIDIDDLLPRSGALAVIGSVGIGIPFAGVLAGVAAGTRATTRGQRWLSAAAACFGALWSIAAFVLFVIVAKA